MSTREETGTDVDDLEGLLNAPEETGDYDCTVPEEYAGTAEDEDTEAPPQPLQAPCSRRYTAVRQSGRRSTSQIGLIVIHCTQSHSARSSAQWFENTRAKGSAHLVVDARECYRTLDDEIIPWGAKGANTRGFHIEIAGFAEWKRDEWMRHKEALRRGAFKAAVHAKKFGVPVRWLTPQQLRAGQKGFVTHANCTQAFGGSHTDPGRHCPTDDFLDMVKGFLN